MKQKIIYVSVGVIVDRNDLGAKPMMFMNRDEVTVPEEPGNETRVGEIFLEACSEVYKTPKDQLFYAIYDGKDSFIPTHQNNLS